MWKYLLSVLLITFLISIESLTVFKMTNLHCESFNQTWIVVNLCRLRAIRRGVSVFNMNSTFLHPATEIHANFEFLKKANGYKPFVINSTLDMCEFMKKKNHPVGNIIYGLFKDYTNINHTCPYVGDQIIDGFYLRPELLKLPLPDGEYLLATTWYFSKFKVAVFNVYFTFQ